MSGQGIVSKEQAIQDVDWPEGDASCGVYEAIGRLVHG